jgi:hypothetical protein
MCVTKLLVAPFRRQNSISVHGSLTVSEGMRDLRTEYLKGI